MKPLFLILTTFLFLNLSIAQTIGNKVSIKTGVGNTYTGVITDIQGNKYKIKYEGYDFDAWLTLDQFTVTQGTATPPSNANTNATKQSTTFKVGDKVEARDNVGNWLPAQVLETDPTKGYKVHYIDYSDYWDAWVGNDRMRATSTKKENVKTNDGSNQTKKDPEMNGAIPKITGTAWSLISIYNKGSAPNSTFTHYPYIFGNNGSYEIQIPASFSKGRYTVKGNQLTQVADGSDRLTEVYTLKWNAAGKYLELAGSETIMRLEYNSKATF